MRPGQFTGGIFMASTVNDLCHVYNKIVPSRLVGAGGDVEHLRAVLETALPDAPQPRAVGGRDGPRGPAHLRDMFDPASHIKGPISLQANQLFWMNDHTPHESRLLKVGQ